MFSVDDIQTIGICGAGTMGPDIAQVAAIAGFRVLLYDVQTASLEQAEARIKHQLQNAVEKGSLPQDAADKAFHRLYFTSDLMDCTAEVFIEAIVEKQEAKTALFNQLSELNHSDVIFASNTSSLSIRHLAQRIPNPSRVGGMRFFQPAHLVERVEITSAPQTAPWIGDTLYELAITLGKKPVRIQDIPGIL